MATETLRISNMALPLQHWFRERSLLLRL